MSRLRLMMTDQSKGKGYQPIILSKGERKAILLFQDRVCISCPDVDSETYNGLKTLQQRNIILRDRVGYRLSRIGIRWLNRIEDDTET